MQHSDPLLEHNRGSGVSLDKRLVSHVESAHELEHGNLDREVEWSDDTNSTEWPSVGGVELTKMVTRLTHGVGKEADTVTTEVFKEVDGDLELSGRLHSAFRSDSLDGLHEEVEHFGVMHAVDNTTVHLAKHQVSLLVMEGVVETALGH